jgi:hypothetical protein
VAGGVPNLDSVRYFFYTMFHECASRGSIEYQTAIVDYPWSRSCIIEAPARPSTHCAGAVPGLLVDCCALPRY